MKHKLLFLFLFTLPFLAESQLVVTTVTPEEAVAALVGPDLEVSNITFTGDVIQIGTFQNAGDNFPITNGMILSTSHVEALMPNGLVDEPLNGVGTEQDLLDIANSVPPLIGQDFFVINVNDVAILEFDFIASGPLLTFKYVFGSDEYLTYVNSQWNDVFAFLLSGPGITGPYNAPAAFPDGAQNIAGVPNSNPFLPITISSVNNVLNNQYYIDNPGGANEPSVLVNGYTDSLRVYADLVCGETYHMKLAIADGSDNILKSIVVFEEGSFQTPGASIEAYSVDGPEGFPGGILIEGCLNGELRLQPPACAAEQLEVELSYSGIAINGVDYEAMPTTVTLQGGEIILPIATVADNINDEVEESLIIDMYYVNLEGVLDTQTTNIIIRDYIAPSVEVNTVYICDNDTVISPDITGGFEPFSYGWSDGVETPTHLFESGDDGEYSVAITDWCGAVFSDDFSVIEPDPIIVPPYINNCIGQQTEDLARMGAPPYTVVYPEDSLTLIDYSFLSEYYGVFEVTFTDQCNSTGTALINVQRCDTRIPNVMTPNGDGKNDNFYISGIEGYKGSTLRVYDRWGNLVFEDEDYKNNWDAAENADGTYFYIFSRSDGKVFTGHFSRIGGK